MKHVADLDSAIVLDAGAHVHRAGYGGDDAPRAQIRTLVGRDISSTNPHQNLQTRTNERQLLYIGNDLDGHAARDDLSLTSPVTAFGHISNWDDYEQLLHHLFHSDMRCEPETCGPLMVNDNVSLTDLASRRGNITGDVDAYRRDVANSGYRGSTRQRERFAQLAFERFRVSGLYSVPSAVASVYSSGCSTCGLVQTNTGTTQFLPMYRGCLIEEGVSCALGMNGRCRSRR